MAYRLALPVEVEKIHNVIHVSMLRRYGSDPTHVISLTEIDLQTDMSYSEESITILTQEIKELRKMDTIRKSYVVEVWSKGSHMETRGNHEKVISKTFCW